MNIEVKTVSGKIINKIVDENDIIGEIIGEIIEEEEDGSELKRIEKLLYDGKILDTDKTFKEYNIPNGALLIGFIRKESEKLPRLSGLNGDTTYGFNMGEFISEVTKMMEELLKLSDEEIDKLLTNSQGDLKIKPDLIPTDSQGISPIDSRGISSIKVGGGSKKSKKRKKTKGKYKKKKRRTKKRKTQKITKKKNMKGGADGGMGYALDFNVDFSAEIGPYDVNFHEFYREIQADIRNMRAAGQPHKIVTLLDLMGDVNWLRNLFYNNVQYCGIEAVRMGLDRDIVDKIFGYYTGEEITELQRILEGYESTLRFLQEEGNGTGTLKADIRSQREKLGRIERRELFPHVHPHDTGGGQLNNIVSLVERVIWYLWTEPSANSLFVLINQELRRDPTMEGSELFPASFRYLTHMTGRKELNCSALPHDVDGYWRGVAKPCEDFWIRTMGLLHFEAGYGESNCVRPEERALVENSFMSWSSSSGVAMRFIERGNNADSEPGRRCRVLFQLKGGVVVDLAGKRIDYNGPIHSSLGRLRSFSAVDREDEFLLKNGFLIFKCDPDGNRYTVVNNVYKYHAYYLSREYFPNYVLLKGIEGIPKMRDKIRMEELVDRRGGVLQRVIEELYRGKISVGLIQTKVSGALPPYVGEPEQLPPHSRLPAGPRPARLRKASRRRK